MKTGDGRKYIFQASTAGASVITAGYETRSFCSQRWNRYQFFYTQFTPAVDRYRFGLYSHRRRFFDCPISTKKHTKTHKINKTTYLRVLRAFGVKNSLTVTGNSYGKGKKHACPVNP
jgi:hypothetical protein